MTVVLLLLESIAVSILAGTFALQRLVRRIPTRCFQGCFQLHLPTACPLERRLSIVSLELRTFCDVRLNAPKSTLQPILIIQIY
ncbi:hypothetical protein F5Y06DRAFT_278296 [Hypoxylon sp. FL0890]|nr:hypothetical protein F5Y06DRAFT_278296 [Hypoxylon sp. FL0890]